MPWEQTAPSHLFLGEIFTPFSWTRLVTEGQLASCILTTEILPGGSIWQRAVEILFWVCPGRESGLPFSSPKKPVHHACPTVAPKEEDAWRDSVWESTHRSLLPTEFIKHFFFLAKMASISFHHLPPTSEAQDLYLLECHLQVESGPWKWEAIGKQGPLSFYKWSLDLPPTWLMLITRWALPKTQPHLFLLSS